MPFKRETFGDEKLGDAMGGTRRPEDYPSETWSDNARNARPEPRAFPDKQERDVGVVKRG